MEAANGLRVLVDKIVALKEQQTDPALVQGACRAGTMQLLHLRKQYREVALTSEALRERVEAAKQQQERCVLQLHTLLYEKQFVEREINSCTNFKSAIPDEEIDLQPPASIPAPSDTHSNPAAPHQTVLMELTHELNARKQLAERLKATQSERKSQAARAAALKSQLEALRSSLQALSQAGSPLASMLSPRVELRPQPRSATLLPAALWALHSQFAAARDALGLPLDIQVAGPVEEAEAEAVIPSPHDESAAVGGGAGDGAAAAAGEGAGKAMVVDGAGAAASGPATKRRRLGAGEVDDAAIYKVHPLSVVLSLSAKEQQQQQQQQQAFLEVTFHYYPTPGLVGACCSGGSGGGGGGDGPLSGLFRGDVGDGQDYEVMAQLAGTGPYKFGGAAARARPYRWAQDLAGVDIIPSLPPGVPGAPKVETLDGAAAHARQQRVQVLVARMEAACGISRGAAPE